MKILSRYILKEFVSNLTLGLVIFTFVLLLEHLFELVDLLMNKGVGLKVTLQLLLLLIPSSLRLTLPMSCLLASLLTFGRFSETNEVTAMRASGLSAWTFIRAPLIVAAAAVIFLIPFNSFWAPHAHARFRQLYLKVLQRNPLVQIEEKTFVEIGDYRLYVEKRERKKKVLRGIVIYKTAVEGAAPRIFAREGRASVNANRGVTLTLYDGEIHNVDPSHPEKSVYTGFETYVLMIPFQNRDQASSRSLDEMDNAELQAQIDDLRGRNLPFPLLSIQKHLRWALAVTPVLFVALGIPLAVRVHRGGRSIGFGVSLVVILGYYALLTGGTGLGQRGIWPAWLAVWLGNLVMAAAAVGLTARLLRR